jgi:hypothetical protein
LLASRAPHSTIRRIIRKIISRSSGSPPFQIVSIVSHVRVVERGTPQFEVPVLVEKFTLNSAPLDHLRRRQLQHGGDAGQVDATAVLVVDQVGVVKQVFAAAANLAQVSDHAANVPHVGRVGPGHPQDHPRGAVRRIGLDIGRVDLVAWRVAGPKSDSTGYPKRLGHRDRA